MSEHEHDWSSWTRWIYYAGASQDFRERYCKKCPGTDEETRPHKHSYSPQPDPYAPIGSSGTVQVCDGCHQPERK